MQFVSRVEELLYSENWFFDPYYDLSRLKTHRFVLTCDISECTGPNRAIYFGFSPKSRIDGIVALENATVILDRNHSQNRMFNCMDSGDGEIDRENSISPYTAICK